MPPILRRLAGAFPSSARMATNLAASVPSWARSAGGAFSWRPPTRLTQRSAATPQSLSTAAPPSSTTAAPWSSSTSAATSTPWSSSTSAVPSTATVRTFGSEGFSSILDARPPLPHVPPPPFLDKGLIIHRANLFTDQDRWDPFHFLDVHKPVMTIKAFGKTKWTVALTEIFKGLLNSLLHLIENIRRSGYSFYDKLSIAHLVIINGRFELRDGVPLRRASNLSYHRDYCYGAFAVEDMIIFSCGWEALRNHPDDLNEFLKRMKDPNQGKGYPMMVDPCMLPLHNRGQAIMDVHNFLRFEIPLSLHIELVSKLAHTSNCEWYRKILKNVLLTKFYTGDGLITTTYNPKNPRDFFRYLRSSVAHSMDYKLKIYHLCPKTSMKIYMTYERDDVQMLLHAVFPLALSDIYQKLWSKWLLKKLKPHLYFRYHL